MQNLTFNLRREKFALLAANQMANLVLEMIELKIGTQSEASLQFYRELEHRYLSNFKRTTGYLPINNKPVCCNCCMSVKIRIIRYSNII